MATIYAKRLSALILTGTTRSGSARQSREIEAGFWLHSARLRVRHAS